MNVHEGRRKGDTGVAFLSEVIADVLTEAKRNGSEGWLRLDTVRFQLGFDHGRYVAGLCRGILDQMYLNGEVECKQDEGGNFAWRLRG